MADSCDPIQCNIDGLECFAAGDPDTADDLLRKAYKNLASETGILVNLGLALMQKKLVDQAERAYRLALQSNERRVRRSAAKNLGFLLLWRGEYERGWHWHGQRFEGEKFVSNQWRGDPLDGQVLTVWNDVGMGDAFQFVRYTLPLLERGEKVRLAVEASQIPIFRDCLDWPLNGVVDRNKYSPAEGGPHIPLMSLIPLLDTNTLWGRRFSRKTWRLPEQKDNTGEQVGICWASNPQDRTMHRYKSTKPEQLLAIQKAQHPKSIVVSLQTDEIKAHEEIGLMPTKPEWKGTLQRITQCKTVISVDTAVAHLAAGCGKPVHMLLGNPPDWRWQPVAENYSAPLWYPNISTETLQ